MSIFRTELQHLPKCLALMADHAHAFHSYSSIFTETDSNEAESDSE